jgi:hypothetical protein
LCMFGFCNVCVCVCVCVCTCGFCNVWVCVCVGFVMCVSFGNKCTCIYCVLYCLYCVFCIVSFMYIFSYLFCLCCYRMTTQLQLVIILIIILINPTIRGLSISHLTSCCRTLSCDGLQHSVRRHSISPLVLSSAHFSSMYCSRY